jgi:hypothetical protein
MQMIYFSPVHWDSYSQRPHYMVRYFLEQNSNNKVLWMNPYPNRFPNWQDFSKITISSLLSVPRKRGSRIGEEKLEVISSKALPIEPLSCSEKINYCLFWKNLWKKLEDFSGNNTIIGVGRPSKLALLALKKLNSQDSFYDAMDDFPEFYSGFSRHSMFQVEKEIAKSVKKIFVSSTYLSQKFPKAIKILNGYDMSSIKSKKLQQGRDDKLIFGFVGTIGQWFDWEVVIELANQFPDAIVRLIGPQYVKYAGKLTPNIETLPECTQAEAIKYVSQFDIGLIPFKQNALTQGVDPIKYYEYRAMGLPVLSTHFGEMNYRDSKDGVYFFEDADKAILHEDNLDKIMLFRKENDWKSRFSACGFIS